MPRNFGLDCVRAFSIWLVILQHAGIEIKGLGPLKTGSIGVEIFFVLSGFLIGGILLKEVDKDKPARDKLLSFWIRRWLRILPLYYALLILKFVLIDHSAGWHIFTYFIFLQNNFYGINFFPVSWSLVIEEWFYLFAPVFLLLLHKNVKSRDKILIAIVFFMIFENIIRFAYVYRWNVPYQGVGGNFPFRFDSLFLGVTLAYLKHYGYPSYKKLESGFVFITGLILLASYLFLFHTWASPVYRIDTLLFPRTIGFFLLSFCITLMIPFLAKLPRPGTTKPGPRLAYVFITQTSILTYAIYLTHSLVFSVTINNLLIPV